VKVKYKQTYLGILWALIQPFFLMLIFYFVFFRALNIRTGIFYPVYAFAGLTLWGLFSSGITHSSESLLSSSEIIRKIYFPRILIPVSSLLTALVDFFFAFLLMIILFFVFKQSVSWSAVYCFPIAIAVTFFSSLGIGSFLAALNVKYRDFRYLLPFGMQLLFFGSQVVYSIHSFENRWFNLLLYCNPLNGALEIFYYPLQAGNFNATGVMISIASMFICLLTGLIYFKKTEFFFADMI
jgi:lipopolysaccharide transport system permease protein